MLLLWASLHVLHGEEVFKRCGGVRPPSRPAILRDQAYWFDGGAKRAKVWSRRIWCIVSPPPSFSLSSHHPLSEEGCLNLNPTSILFQCSFFVFVTACTSNDSFGQNIFFIHIPRFFCLLPNNASLCLSHYKFSAWLSLIWECNAMGEVAWLDDKSAHCFQLTTIESNLRFNWLVKSKHGPLIVSYS